LLIQLNERAGLQGRPDGGQMGFKHLPGGFQSEVPRAHQHQFPRSDLQQMGVVEVGVLGHHYPPLIHRYHIQDAVTRRIPIRQVQLMDRIVTGIVKNSAQAGWQVRVDEELYFPTLPARRDASSLTTTTDPSLASYTTDCVIRLPRPRQARRSHLPFPPVSFVICVAI
jgi:hypothetical protein